MRLLRFSISERRGEPARNLDFGVERGGHGLVRITGPEGSGKSSVLEAIALHKEHVAPYRAAPSARDFLGQGLGVLTIESEWQLSQLEKNDTGSEHDRLLARSVFRDGRGEIHADAALIHVLARFHLDEVTSKVDLFPESRLGPARGIAAGEPAMWQRMHRLSLGTDKFVGLSKLLDEADERKRGLVAALLAELCPGLGLAPEGVGFETRHGSRKLAELSLSQRLAFELAATFVLVGLTHSVVLIDGVERGFPGGAAARVVQALRSFAPKAQLIVTTNDPGLLALPDGQTLHLENP